MQKYLFLRIKNNLPTLKNIYGNKRLKGQSNEIFDLQFFSSIEPALATEYWPMG